jgi:hypothetical protein
MRKARLPAVLGGILIRLRLAALIALVIHLLAGASMALILSRGLETNSDFHERLAFLTNHRGLWTAGWLTWTAAAFAILYFYAVFVEAHPQAPRLAVLLTVSAIAPDLAAQSVEIGVLPGLAHRAIATNAAPELFLMMHRIAVLMSGYVANGLYSLTAFILAWSTRRAFPTWVWVAGIAVGIFGFALSAAALFDSATGMLWTNVLLLPTLLLWLGGVAHCRDNIPKS